MTMLNFNRFALFILAFSLINHFNFVKSSISNSRSESFAWRSQACMFYTMCALRVKEAQEDCGGQSTMPLNDENCEIVTNLRQELVDKHILFFSLLGECTTNGTVNGHMITKAGITTSPKPSKGQAEHCPETVDKFEESEQNRSNLNDDKRSLQIGGQESDDDSKRPRNKKKGKGKPSSKEKADAKRAKKRCRNRVKKLRRTCSQLKQCCSTAKQCIVKLQKMHILAAIQQIREDLKSAIKLCKK